MKAERSEKLTILKRKMNRTSSNTDTVIKQITNHIKGCVSTSHCHQCGNRLEDDRSEGFIVCVECGLVEESFIDPNAEWRSFTSSNGIKNTNGVRCGYQSTVDNNNPTSTLFVGGFDKKIRQVHDWNVYTIKEREMYKLRKEFENIAYTYHLPDRVSMTASTMYGKLDEKIEQQVNRITKKCHIKLGLKAACLYFACIKEDCPRERREISEIFDQDIKLVNKGCSVFLDVMGGEYLKLEPLKAIDLVKRYAELFDLTYANQLSLKKAVEYLSNKPELMDSTPNIVTLATILLLGNIYDWNIDSDSVGRKLKCSSSAVKRFYERLFQYKDSLTVILQEKQ